MSLAATALVTLALGTSPASASPYCGGQQVNNVQRCWGVIRVMSGAEVVGASTGACAGADTYSGTCAPQGQRAYIDGLSGEHNPWAQGTASALTYVAANTF
ncbi:MAG: hypothetical protein JST08_01650 [Actinobacteria bacterium]|nr:hypothetical protein [Actinomycetota bacterium]